MRRMIVLIDNYDSFTYNLVHYLGELGSEAVVHRNDQISVAEVLDLKPEGLVISPGPSDPDHAGICLELVKAAYDNDLPLLGVCLGHQTIGQAFGGHVVQTTPMHGKLSNITHNNKGPFKDIPSPFEVTRYHSLVVKRETLPEELEITAETEGGIIMGLSHKSKPIHGLQFHPESIATEHGHKLIRNFLEDL